MANDEQQILAALSRRNARDSSAFRAADAALLDPCDKHRDEGGGAYAETDVRNGFTVHADSERRLPTPGSSVLSGSASISAAIS
ncbi:hypothetical protein GHK48_23305 [Sinorhizobium fredii]|uniref:Uncharacterized protein n=1 Tax=Rhizobium fredii TaxID=380 RepID=A0A844AGM7_RHIFR|nr:hypothetical protein [Sinorhizobium fredii]MQX11118.1 hypothetical protein [Sinorhizobium fredii]UTY49928.1 hypothetical protein EPK84_25800 [Sinorhizobium fredii]